MKKAKSPKNSASAKASRRGRGRPPGSLNKKGKMEPVAKVPGRGRGRPAGSTVVKLGRGRPAGTGAKLVVAKASKRGSKSGDTGRRYSDAERQKILAVVNSSGRGGITKATKQFGVSYIALRRWMQSSGIPIGRSGALDSKKLNDINEVTSLVKSVRKQMTSVFQLLKKIAK